MKEVRTILEDLRARSDEVVSRWAARIEVEPWLALPEEAKIDHVPELVDAVVSAILADPSTREARERAVRIACRHGQERRRQGLQDAVLHREHHLLRASIWDVVRERHGGDAAAYEAISRIDMGTTMTTTGSLHGYHVDDPEERDAVARRLAEEGPWPDPV